MTLKLITAPIVEPITLSDLEGQCRATLTAESATVALIISAVRQKAETALSRALINQTWDLVLDEFLDEIEIPRPPLVSVSSVKYYDTDGVLQTLASTEYTVDTDSTPGRVYPAYGKTWPITQDRPGAVRIQFVAGYGAPTAWDALKVYAVDERMLYTDGKTYRKTATSAAGVLPTDTTKWAADSPGYAVPACIRQWCLLNAANLFENRETIVVGQRAQMVELVTLADSLLDPERWDVQI